MARCLSSIAWLAACVMLLSLATPSPGEITFVGEAVLPGTTKDLSGLKGKTRDGTPADQLGGIGSGIAYTGTGDRYILIADRGPKDGDTDFICRFHEFDISVDPRAKNPVNAKLVTTTLLTDGKGHRLVGSSDALDAKAPVKSLRFDPEGVRVGPKGTIFVSDEYGPWVCEFDRKGQKLRDLPIPARYQPERPAKLPADEMPPKNRRGRQPNRGMEGLAISPEGGTLFGLMQSPLIQDGAINEKGERVGVNNRLLALEVATGRTREYVYQLENADAGVSEIVAISATRFLVLERDGLASKDAKHKKVYLIDADGATDVSGVDALPSLKLPVKVKPTTKTLFLDLLDRRFGLAGTTFPAKAEGLAFGPDLPDGRRLLLVTTDNDFDPKAPMRIWAFAINKADLPGYQAQQMKRD